MEEVKNIYSGKKILVLGGTGAIGYHLVEKLKKFSCDIKVVSYDSVEYSNILFGNTIDFERADLTKEDVCHSIMDGANYVFNLVGIKGSIGGHTELSKEFISYIKFQTNIMESAYKKGIERFLFVSSICGYPQMEIPKKESDMWSGMPTQNDKYHGICKRIGEIQALSYHEENSWHGIRIARPSNCYGPYDDFNPNTAQVIPALISKATSGQNRVDVMGDGSSIRDFIYMEDVAEGLLSVFEKGYPSDPINLGSGIGVSIKRITEIIKEITNVEFIFDSTKYSGDKIRILSTEKCEAITGFKCKTSIEDGIKKTIDWYNNNNEITKLKGRYNAKR